MATVTLTDCGFEPADTPFPPRLATEATQALCEGLVGLGFSMLGIEYEVGAGHHKMRSLSFGNPTTQTFASIWESSRGPMLYLLTSFADDAAVLTAYYERAPVESKFVRVRGVTTGTFVHLSLVHQRSVNELIAEGHQVRPGCGRVERLESIRSWYRNPDYAKI